MSDSGVLVDVHVLSDGYVGAEPCARANHGARTEFDIATHRGIGVDKHGVVGPSRHQARSERAPDKWVADREDDA